MSKNTTLLLNLKCGFITACLLISLGIRSQNPTFKHLTTNEGLSSGNIWSITQDSKGYLWFGTEDGLNKYDAYRFTVYRHNPADNTSISDNAIQAIMEDSDGLWIGTINGLNKYNYQTESFKQYFHDDKDSTSLSSSAIYDILKDKQGRIWIATNRGFDLYNKRTNNFNKYLYKSNSITGAQVRSITIDSKNTLWLSTYNGLYQYDPEKNNFTSYLNNLIVDKSFGSNFIHHIYIDKRKNIWIGTELDGLFYYDASVHQLYHYTHNPADPQSLCHNQINHIMEDYNGNIWISTNGGLSYIPYGTKLGQNNSIFKNIKQKPNDKNGLSTNIISTTYQAKNYQFWVGGRFGDIDIMDNPNKQFFNRKFTDIDNRFTSNNMTAMVEDNDGNIWFGTDGGGLYFWDRNKDEYIVYKNIYRNKNSLACDKVLALYLDSYNILWIGMWDGGIDKLNIKTKTFYHYKYNPTDIKTISGNNIYCISEDRQKNIWIGLWNAGVNVYNRKQNNFKRFPFGTAGSTSMNGPTAVCIYADKKNNLWIGSEVNGLNLLDRKNNTFQYYKKNNDDTCSLSNNGVNCIYEDMHNRLWVGTKEGLNLFDTKKRTFRRFTVKDGLPNEIICEILEDKKGNLWISTNNGISKVTLTENQNQLIVSFKNFDKYDGLQNNQFNRWSSLKTKRGELIFGGINGVNIFFPDSIRDNTMIPPIVLTGFSIFNKPVLIGKPGSPLKMHISETKSLVLSYKQSVFSFDYAALNYINTNKNRYAYKMEGFETEWNYVGGQRKATYTNLDPGKYIFRVIGCNNDGYWNNEGVSLQITITPPWWKTIWFKLLVLIICILSFYSAYSVRVAMYNRKQKELIKLVDMRTREIAQANKILVERQSRIEEQSENLTEANHTLISNQRLIEAQANQLQKTNQQLSILNSTKDRLFSIIAHDLRNPFHVVKGFSELLITDYKKLPFEKVDKYLYLINSSSTNGTNLLDNLLQWSRSQTGQISFDPIHVSLTAMFLETINLLEANAHQKNIKIHIRLENDIVLFADENMIKAVLRNLISNAIKFTAENGLINVKATCDQAQVEVTIEDTGIGIDPNVLPLLFHIENTVSTKGTAHESGTGLGLLLCKEFIEKHNGIIWVESEVGKGSKFTFTLPVA